MIRIFIVISGFSGSNTQDTISIAVSIACGIYSRGLVLLLIRSESILYIPPLV